MIKLYSTGCPKCNVIKKKLTLKNIEFQEITDVEEMNKLNMKNLPVLEVDGKIYEFVEANAYINSL